MPEAVTPVTVRAYRTEDRAAMIALVAEMQAHYDGDDAASLDDITNAFDRAQATLRDTVLLVAPDATGALAGYLTAAQTWPGDGGQLCWWLKEVYVATDARWRGVGKALIAAFLEHAQRAGGGRVDIAADRANPTAIGLYQRLGATMTNKVILRFNGKDDAGSLPREGVSHA